MTKDIKALWTRLDTRRRPMLSRLEGYASLTIPRLIEPLGADEQNSTINRDHQSVGAQGSNHLTNKVMLTMFSPSRPFIRLETPPEDVAKLVEQGVPEEEVEASTFEGEMRAVREMDNRPVRPILHETLLHLVVLGNALLNLPKGGEAAVYGIRDYVCQRTRDGRWRTIVLHREHLFQDLEEDLQEYLQAATNKRYQPETICKLYTKIERSKGRVTEALQVDDVQVDLSAYVGDVPEEDSEWHPEVWNLRSGAHYGTGHVEDFSGDLAALSIMSKAQVEAAILASEFRWLLRPGAQTSAKDLEESHNGAVIPGEKDDLELLYANVGQQLSTVRETAADYIRRIGFGFLMNSAVTRDAERVTTEEIRQQALELETSLGGVYSRLAGTLQLAVARWLLREVKIDVKNTRLKVRIVTGLDALSRNGDLAALRGALGDIAALQNVGPAANELNLAAVINAIFMGWGVRSRKFLKTPDQKAADQAAAEQADARALGREAAVQPTQGPR
jgi:hypothetical protein